MRGCITIVRPSANKEEEAPGISAGAEEELRLVFDQVAAMMKQEAPNLFQDYPVLTSIQINGSGDLIVNYADPIDSGSTTPTAA